MSRKKKTWEENLKFFLYITAGIIFISLAFRTITTFKNSLFDGKNRFTIIISSVQNPDALILSIEPKDKYITFLVIPSDIYKVEASKNGELLRRNAQNFIAAPVDGWIIVNEKLKIKNEKLGRPEIEDVLSIRSAFKYNTNLTIFDIFRVWYAVSQAPPDRIDTVSLKKEDKSLPRIIATLLGDREVLAEGKTIEIINGTSIVGLAGNIAQIIENMGGNVVFVKTGDVEIEKSSIRVIEESYTAKKISSSFDIPITKGKYEDLNSDIQVLIGKDY